MQRKIIGVEQMDNLLKSEPLHMQAYTVLKTAILAGDFQDERVNETQLASKFGVSRGPVREAIRMLLQDGLLTQKNGTIQVFRPTTQDIIDILQCRQGLEETAIRLAVKQITSEEQQQLLQCIEETKAAYEMNDVKELEKLDQQFHDIILESARNKQLIQLMEIIKSKIIYIRNNLVSKEYVHSFPEGHERIYEAIVAKDVKKAENEIAHHIQKRLKQMTEEVSL